MKTTWLLLVYKISGAPTAGAQRKTPALGRRFTLTSITHRPKACATA